MGAEHRSGRLHASVEAQSWLSRLVLAGLMLLVVLFASACSSRTAPQTPVPRSVESYRLLPIDLDVVVRIDIAQIYQEAPELAAAVQLGEYLGPGLSGSSAAILSRSTVAWIGMRVAPRPEASSSSNDKRGGGSRSVIDAVVILEGDYSQIDRSLWLKSFAAPRELGGGFRRYDAIDDTRRHTVGRVYEELGKRLIFATSAEVDAAERAIERGQLERTRFPYNDGLLAFAARTEGMADAIRLHSARAADFVAHAEEFRGQLVKRDEQLRLSLDIVFATGEDAERAQLAFAIIGRVLGLQQEQTGVSIAVERSDRTLQLQAVSDLAHAYAWMAAAQNRQN